MCNSSHMLILYMGPLNETRTNFQVISFVARIQLAANSSVRDHFALFRNKISAVFRNYRVGRRHFTESRKRVCFHTLSKTQQISPTRSHRNVEPRLFPPYLPSEASTRWCCSKYTDGQTNSNWLSNHSKVDFQTTTFARR